MENLREALSTDCTLYALRRWAVNRADGGACARNKSLEKHFRVIKACCLSYLEPCSLEPGRTTSSDKPGCSHRCKEHDAETAVAAASSALIGGSRSPRDIDDQGGGVIVKIPVRSRHGDTVHDPETVIPDRDRKSVV